MKKEVTMKLRKIIPIISATAALCLFSSGCAAGNSTVQSSQRAESSQLSDIDENEVYTGYGTISQINPTADGVTLLLDTDVEEGKTNYYGAVQIYISVDSTAEITDKDGKAITAEKLSVGDKVAVTTQGGTVQLSAPANLVGFTKISIALR